MEEISASRIGAYFNGRYRGILRKFNSVLVTARSSDVFHFSFCRSFRGQKSPSVHWSQSTSRFTVTYRFCSFARQRGRSCHAIVNALENVRPPQNDIDVNCTLYHYKASCPSSISIHANKIKPFRLTCTRTIIVFQLMKLALFPFSCLVTRFCLCISSKTLRKATNQSFEIASAEGSTVWSLGIFPRIIFKVLI